MVTMRLVLGILVLVVAGWFFSALLGTPEETASAQGPAEWVSSQQCAECHEQIYQEWSNSPHANSWNNEDVRVQSDDFSNKDCIDCHAPRPVFETGLGERVLPRSARRSEGVDCLTCHMLPGGGMAGTITNPRVACQPVTRRELRRVSLCAGCHDQHKTVQQWKATPFAEHRDGCMECHMPYRDGTPEGGRLHTMPGGHYIEMVQTAVTLTGSMDDQGVRSVTVANVGGGHAYPTDERSRASDLWWRTVPAGASLGADGVAENGGAWQHLHRIRDPYRHETDMVSTLLHFGESRTLTINGPAAENEAVEVALVYKRTPYYRNKETGIAMHLTEVTNPFADSELVHRVVIEP
ncbi:MAG: hypothetical protein ACJA0P_000614 [Planctomycetota bacterium]|jgi:hypothetical protein